MWWGILVEEGGQGGIIAKNTLRATTGDGSGGGIYLNSLTGEGGTDDIAVTGNVVHGDLNATKPDGSGINGVMLGSGVLCTASGNTSVNFSNNNAAVLTNDAAVVGNHFDGSLYEEAPDAVIANNL